MTLCFRATPRCWATTREMVSVALPGPNGDHDGDWLAWIGLREDLIACGGATQSDGRGGKNLDTVPHRHPAIFSHIARSDGRAQSCTCSLSSYSPRAFHSAPALRADLPHQGKVNRDCRTRDGEERREESRARLFGRARHLHHPEVAADRPMAARSSPSRPISARARSSSRRAPRR